MFEILLLHEDIPGDPVGAVDIAWVAHELLDAIGAIKAVVVLIGANDHGFPEPVESRGRNSGKPAGRAAPAMVECP